MAGAADPEPMPEPVGTWFFERNTWAEHNLGNPSRSKGAVTETDAVVGCSDHFECDSAGSATRLGRGARLRNPFLLLLRTRGLPDKRDCRQASNPLPDRVLEELEGLKTLI